MDDFQNDFVPDFPTYIFDKLTKFENLQYYLEATARLTNNCFKLGKHEYA